jgi:hypothetical protein
MDSLSEITYGLEDLVARCHDMALLFEAHIHINSIGEVPIWTDEQLLELDTVVSRSTRSRASRRRVWSPQETSDFIRMMEQGINSDVIKSTFRITHDQFVNKKKVERKNGARF